MRIFISTGEPSGELCALAFAAALREKRADIEFSGIGGDRMRDAGFALTAHTQGWATLGPLAAARNVPKLLRVIKRVAAELVASPPDLVVLLDFGAFHVRLARALRKAGFAKPIFYGFPPSAWLDRPKVAQAVAELTDPVTPFTHQRDFYRSLNLKVSYFGHPLVEQIPMREQFIRSANGRFVFLPGSRDQEIVRNLPCMLAVVAELRNALPHCEIVFVASDARAEKLLRSCIGDDGHVEQGARRWLAWADAACVASGTAVLEAMLVGVPTVAMYILSRLTAEIAKRVYRGRFVTLPNLILERMAVPEFLQDQARPPAIAAQMLALRYDARAQTADASELRTSLDGQGTLQRWADHAFALMEASA